MRRILFRLDASTRVGFGHLRRCLHLATRFSHIESFFLIKGSVKDLKIPFPVRFIPESKTLSEEVSLIEAWNQEIGFNGILFDFSNSTKLSCFDQIDPYWQAVRKSISRLVVIDGLGPEALIDHCHGDAVTAIFTPYAGIARVTHRPWRHYVGPAYFVFDPELEKIRKNHIRDPVKNLLVTMGGSDPSQMTEFVLSSLLRAPWVEDMQLRTVIGPLFQNERKKNLEQLSKEKKLWTLELSPSSLAPHFQWADLVISATGLTKYEIAFVGLPSVQISHSSDAAEINRSFELLGTAWHLGAIHAVSSEIFLDKTHQLCLDQQARQQMLQASLQLFPQNSLGAYALELTGEI